MPENISDCQRLNDLSWTGVRICRFGGLCKGNQEADNCLLADKITHNEEVRRTSDWSENDEPIAS